ITRCCACLSRPRSKYTSCPVMRLPPASANPVFLQRLRRLLTPFSPRLGNASVACPSEPPTWPNLARQNHELLRQNFSRHMHFFYGSCFRDCSDLVRGAALQNSFSQARCCRFKRGFPSGLQSPHFAALPELPSRWRLPLTRRRQP